MCIDLVVAGVVDGGGSSGDAADDDEAYGLHGFSGHLHHRRMPRQAVRRMRGNVDERVVRVGQTQATLAK
jgi:hypothetical protein